MDRLVNSEKTSFQHEHDKIEIIIIPSGWNLKK